jgi:hypothetical protein
LVASEQDLEQRKDALGSRRIWRHGEGDTGRLAPDPEFRGIAFPPTQNPFSEVALITVINGKAISRSNLSRQVALQSRHEVRPLPKQLDFGKPRHEINGNAPFRHVRWAEETREFADQLRMSTLKHRITRATAAEREAISTISISGCPVAYTMMCASTFSSSLLP